MKAKQDIVRCKSCGLWAKGYCDLRHEKRDWEEPACRFWESREAKMTTGVSGGHPGTVSADIQYHGTSEDRIHDYEA